MKRIFMLLTVTGMVAGCMTLPASQEDVYVATYVGDRHTLDLKEIIVSVPRAGGSGEIRNLHIFFSAIINPIKKSTANEYDAGGIVRSAQARIAAELIADIVEGKIDTSRSMASIRFQIQERAKAILDPIYSTWTHAESFRVELVLTSLYFTDGSAGKSSVNANSFW